ncbi:MAG: hypothetical protein IT244_06765 [Bacteroidia bacterium]|nr:hypothetical protein [Bacteroidia bacterium]
MNRKFDTLPVWLAKIILPEFWSSYIIYAQAFLFVSWHTLKNGNRFYPVLLNPAIDETGGFANPSKSKINSLFPAKYLPKSLEWNLNENANTFISECSEKIGFPCFIKPDNLYQGIGVQKVYSKEEMVQYLNQYTANCTVQEFVDLQEEFAVFITKFPGETLKIQSLVQKEFLTITGNGTENIQQLLNKKLRYRMARKKIDPFWVHRFGEIPGVGENLLIQPVGNHNRGTCFYNITHQITPKMEHIFHQIVPQHGIYYGRFDVKAKDLQSLETGDHLFII